MQTVWDPKNATFEFLAGSYFTYGITRTHCAKLKTVHKKFHVGYSCLKNRKFKKTYIN